MIDTDTMLDTADATLRSLVENATCPWHGILTSWDVSPYVDSDGEDSLLVCAYWPEELTDIDDIVERTMAFPTTVADKFREAKISLYPYVRLGVERTENTDYGEE